MRVRDVMTSHVVTIPPTATFKAAVETMLATGVSGLPVVSRDGRLIGIVTETDLVSKQAYRRQQRTALAALAMFLRDDDPRWLHKAGGMHVRDIMTAKVTTVSPDDPVGDAARLMLQMRRTVMPVMDAGKLVGIVSRRDLLRVFSRSDDDIAREARAVLASPRWVPDDHHVTASVHDGVVRLEGSVHFAGDRSIVLTAIRSVEGVVAVDDRLGYEENNPVVHGPIDSFG